MPRAIKGVGGCAPSPRVRFRLRSRLRSHLRSRGRRAPARAGRPDLPDLACPKLASSLSTTCLAPPPPPGQTVFDEEVGVADIALGAASVHLADLLKPNGNEAQRTWSGWLPLTWRPSETQDNVLLGVGAGQVGK